MIELIDLVDERFMPHGHCYFWEPSVLWSYAISDSIIAIAYFSIPLALLYIYLKRKDFTYVWMIILFAIFIAGCGITHVFDVVNIWRPLYHLDVIARIITAMASIGTAAVLIKFTPKIIDIPTAEQWKKVNEELLALNEELRAQLEELKEKDKTIQAYKEFERITETLPQMVWTTNPNITNGNKTSTGEALYINRRWYEYTGYSEQTPFQELIVESVVPEQWEELQIKWRKSRETLEAFNSEIQIRRFDGAYRWHTGKGVYIASTNSWVGTFTDIDDQKTYSEMLAKKNEELVRINTDLDSFIYTASHDLKSPIANMEGLAIALTKKLTTKYTLDDELNRILSMIAGSITRLKLTISDLTEIAKVQKEDADKEIISVRDMIAEVATSLDQLMLANEVQLDKRIEVNKVAFAPKNLRSIIYNLLSNAIKYRSPERTPETVIETRKLDHYLLISVADNGMGIAENNQSKLFRMFKRFHTHVEGTGIGLYIVKRIVENAGGKIEVESKLNVGTKFSIFLPYT
jgi:PAS domain S-box-containing protein